MFASSLKKYAAVAALAIGGLFATGQAQAQATGNVDVSVSLTNGIVILYYYSTLNVTIPVDQLTTAAPCTPTTGAVGRGCAVTPTPAATVTVGATQIDADFNITNNPAPVPQGGAGAIPLRLANVWAVRAIGSAAGNTQVAIAANGALPHSLTGSNGGNISFTGYGVSTGATCPGAATVTFAPPGLVTAQTGSVCVTMDMSGATRIGDYTRATAEYTLTATNL